MIFLVLQVCINVYINLRNRIPFITSPGKFRIDEMCIDFTGKYLHKNTNQGKSEGFDSCDRPHNLKQSHWIQIVNFVAGVTWRWNLTDDLKKQKGTSSWPLDVMCVIL